MRAHISQSLNGETGNMSLFKDNFAYRFSPCLIFLTIIYHYTEYMFWILTRIKALSAEFHFIVFIKLQL